MKRLVATGLIATVVLGCGGGGATNVVIDVHGPLTMVSDPPIVRLGTSTKFIAFGDGHSPEEFEWRTGVASPRMTPGGVYTPDALGLEMVIGFIPGIAVIQRTAKTIPANVAIVFASDVSGRSEIWSINEDGTGLTQWTTDGGTEPVGSTDETFFYYRKGQELWVRVFNNGETSEGVFDTYSSGLHPMEVKHSYTGIDFLNTHHVIWRYTPVGGPTEYILIQNETTYLQTTTSVIDSFDTRNLRITLSIETADVRQLFSRTGFGVLQQITFGSLNCVDPSNGLDGRTIYFAGFDGLQWDIYKVDQFTGTVTNLTNSPSIDEQHPGLSPEGSRLVYSRGTGTSHEIWTMKTSGKDKRALVSGHGDCLHPDYLILPLP